MVNASLNWASIVGIVLAVGGALLYFMRSFKPALARDYDVFFAAIGLLCGGILFFQGWRLDPILQFGQFLLAGTTVFFAYESVRLRGITTEQARRSSFIDDEDGAPVGPRIGGRDAWGNDLDRLDEPEPLRRRIRSRQGMDERTDEEDFYRPRTSPRTAIPERAVSRSGRPAQVATARKGLAATASAMDRLQGRPMAAAALAHRLTPPLASVPVAAIGTRADAAPAPVPSAAPTTCPARDAGLRAAPAGPLASLRSAAAAQCPRDRQLPAPAPTASALEQARSLA